MSYIFITDRKGVEIPKPISKEKWEASKKYYLSEGYREATHEEIIKFHPIENNSLNGQQVKEDKPVKRSRRKRAQKEAQEEE